MIESPSNNSLELLGWTECFGIGLWGHENHPNIMIDTNADVVSVFDFAQSEIDSLLPEEEEKFFRDNNIPINFYV